MSDLVFIRGLQIETVIGVYGWEREVRQLLTVDLDMAWPTEAAAASDDVAHALDYARVSQRLREHASESRVELIETLASAIAGLVREEFAVPWLRVTVNKPGAVPEAESVGVVIERGTQP